MQVLDHEPDNGTNEQKLNSLNLILKSISAHELKNFNEIYSSISNNNNRISSITKSTIRLTNLTNNLTFAANKLITLEHSAYRITNRTDRYNQLANNWLQQTGYGYL